jgi:hypothetical protein
MPKNDILRQNDIRAIIRYICISSIMSGFNLNKPLGKANKKIYFLSSRCLSRGWTRDTENPQTGKRRK